MTKFLDSTKFKTFSDYKSNVAESISLLDRVENIVGKGDNAGYQHCLLFPQYFQTASSSGLLKVRVALRQIIKATSRDTVAQFVVVRS